MEAEEIQAQRCKFSRGGSNGRTDTTTKLGLKGSNSNGTSHHQFPDDEDGELKRVNSNAIVSIGGGGGDGGNRLRGWHHNSSRIIRVSRASGGKDRHSKVWTSKGLRDRRVRLSVTTAIQFYDLQDRLGYDQPSKAVEWLINAAADAISELPSLSSSFPETPKQLSDGKRGNDDRGAEHGFDSADLELEDPNFSLGGGNHNQSQNQQLSLSKSACSSTSETSKGSGLSLARSDARVKARERARERTAKEKEKDGDHQHQNVNPISQNSTFTELLTGGISGTVSNSNNNNNPSDNTSSPTGSEANFFHKAAGARQWPLAPMDYFGTGLFGQSSSRSTHHSSGFSGQIQLGNTVIPQAAMTMSIPPFHISGENHHHHQQHQHHHNHQEQMQHFPFDHLIPVATPTTTAQQGSGGDYNLNFTISSGLSGFNRGTLQSNSSSVHSLLPHIQRFSSSSSLEGSTSVPFFIGAAPPQPMENHHHNHHHQFPPGLQLCYGDGSRHSHDQKGKGKN